MNSSSCRGFCLSGFSLALAFFWWGHTLGPIQDHGLPTSAHTASVAAWGTLSLNHWISRDIPDFLALAVRWAWHDRSLFLWPSVMPSLLGGQASDLSLRSPCLCRRPVRLGGTPRYPSCIRHRFSPTWGQASVHEQHLLGSTLELLLEF